MSLSSFILTHSTRQSAESKDSILTAMTHWECPFCSLDARPTNLVKDGFLQEVCNALETNGQIEPRAVVVKSDGSFTLKSEVENGSMRKTDQRDGVKKVVVDEPDKAGSRRTSPAKRVSEIIELDDD